MRRISLLMAALTVGLFVGVPQFAFAQTCWICTAPLFGDCVPASPSSGYWLCNDMYCLDAACSQVACKRACPCSMDLLECYAEGGDDLSPFDPPIIRARPHGTPTRSVATRAMLWKRDSGAPAISGHGSAAPHRPISVASFDATEIAEAIARHTRTGAAEWHVSFAHISYAPSGKGFGFMNPAGAGYVLKVVPQGHGSLVVVRAAEAGSAGRRLASGHVAPDQILLAPVELDGEPMFLAVDATLLPVDHDAVAREVDALRRPFVDGLRAYPRKEGRRDLEPKILD